MAAEERTAGRGTIATVVATAAVTLAIGVTAAALGGYLVPARERDSATAMPASEPVVVETPPAPATGATDVVLVPVAPDGRGAPSTTVSAPREPDVLFAGYDRADHDDDDEGDDPRSRKHHEHEEDDHDDDDDDD